MPTVKYYLKRILSCFLLDNTIYIGISDTKHDFLEIKNTSENRNTISEIIKKGISEKDIQKNKIASLLFNSNYLSSQKISRNTNRNYLFVEYLNTINQNPFYLDKKILHQPIIIIGCGGIGSLILYQLAQFGFINITLFEGDKISITDMQRIPIWRRKEIGKNKTIVMQRILKENFNLSIKINSVYANATNLDKYVKQNPTKLIIKTADPEMNFNLSLDRIAKKYNVPYISMAYSYDLVKIGPLVIPGKTIDYTILDKASKKIMGDKKTPFKSKKLFSDYFVHPSVCFNINIGAGLGFMEILFFLAEKYEWIYTLGKEIQFPTLDKRLFINDYKYLLEALEK